MNIGNKLKTLRTAKGYSSDHIAELLDISKTTYGRYERNETVPDLNILEKIAKEYEITISELLMDERLIYNQKNKEEDNNGLVINHLKDKIIALYEKALSEKNDIITELKSEINKFKKSK